MKETVNMQTTMADTKPNNISTTEEVPCHSSWDSCIDKECGLFKGFKGNKTRKRALRDTWCSRCNENWRIAKRRNGSGNVAHFLENGGALRSFFVKCNTCKMMKRGDCMSSSTGSVCELCYATSREALCCSFSALEVSAVEKVRPILPDDELHHWQNCRLG